MEESLVREVVRRAVGAEVAAVAALEGGQVGRVFRAEAGRRSWAVKFMAAVAEPAFDKEDVDNRVYGARWSNLAPAHALLKASGVAVPALRATGRAKGFDYAILDFVDGDEDDYSPGWFAAVGRGLARIHQVRRPWQGWIGAPDLGETWSEAFARSLASRLTQARPVLEADLIAAAARRIAAAGPVGEPPTFVLSHTDGFSGVMRKGAGGWELAGVVDIEDHQFTDPRFVLAGFAVSHAVAGRRIPSAFGEAYGGAADDGCRTVFQLYYLLTWARVLKADEPTFRSCVSALAALLRGR